MKTFIRVVELWVPDRTRTRLEFGGSLCSEEFAEFRAVSENALFAYDEGLPGKAWASGHPVILTKFANSYFKRTDEAIEAGLTCGVALPVFAGEFLMAVMALFCGDDEKHVGAIELPCAKHQGPIVRRKDVMRGVPRENSGGILASRLLVLARARREHERD